MRRLLVRLALLAVLLWPQAALAAGTITCTAGVCTGAMTSWSTLLNTANTWSALQTFSAGLTVSGGNITVAAGGQISAGQFLTTGGSDSFNFGGDTLLFRDAPNTLAQRNGTNAQESRVYNTYTDASNWEMVSLGWQNIANVFTIQTEALGTGTVRNIAFMGGKVSINTATVLDKFTVWNVGTSDVGFTLGRDANTSIGAFRFYTDNTSDWIVGLRGTGDSNLHIYSYSTAADAILVERSTGNVGIGTTAIASGQKVEINGGLNLTTATAQPGCTSATRGTLWVVQNGAGVKDQVEACAKDAADAYAWRVLY